GGVGHADVPEVRARRPLVRRLGREAPAILEGDVRRPDVPQGTPREGLMAKCPWPPCGQELGAVAGDKSIVVDHPGHRAWAEDPDFEYVPADRVEVDAC